MEGFANELKHYERKVDGGYMKSNLPAVAEQDALPHIPLEFFY